MLLLLVLANPFTSQRLSRREWRCLSLQLSVSQDMFVARSATPVVRTVGTRIGTCGKRKAFSRAVGDLNAKQYETRKCSYTTFQGNRIGFTIGDMDEEAIISLHGARLIYHACQLTLSEVSVSTGQLLSSHSRFLHPKPTPRTSRSPLLYISD
jgi:hypothetical protein